MISRNSKPLFVFLLMGLFVVGEIGAIAQSKSPHTAEFNAPATAPSGPAITPKPTPIKIGGVTFSGSIRILRWGNQTEDSSFGYIPFGGQIQEERAFGGYTIPSKVGVGWRIGTDRYFEFFRAQIEDAVFR